MTEKNFVIIALGSNLGDRYHNLTQALDAMKASVDIENCSHIYESDALLPLNAPKNWNHKFYNCIFYGKTKLNINSLLSLCQDVEVAVAGKKRSSEAWSPRVLDLDIISYNQNVIDQHEIVVPHPKLTDRDFVLYPLVEILPEWEHPVLKITAKDLAKKLEVTTNIKKLDIKPI